MEQKYTLAELKEMPTIHSGHFDNLKLDDGNTRITLSRMTIADGMPYNNQVTVLTKDGKGDWKEVRKYEAK